MKLVPDPIPSRQSVALERDAQPRVLLVALYQDPGQNPLQIGHRDLGIRQNHPWQSRRLQSKKTRNLANRASKLRFFPPKAGRLLVRDTVLQNIASFVRQCLLAPLSRSAHHQEIVRHTECPKRPLPRTMSVPALIGNKNGAARYIRCARSPCTCRRHKPRL